MKLGTSRTTWLQEHPAVVTVVAVGGLVSALAAVLGALETRSGRAALLIAACLLAVLGLAVARRSTTGTWRRRTLAVGIVLITVAGAAVAGLLILRDERQPTETGVVAVPTDSPDPASPTPAAEFTVHDIRLARWQQQGVEVDVAMSGGDRAAYVVMVELLQVARQPECRGGGSVDWIQVDAAAGIVTDAAGSTTLVATQRSDSGDDSSVDVHGESRTSRCDGVDALTLRPQQPLEAGGLGQLRLRVPASYRVAEVLYSPPDGSERRPASEVVQDPSVQLSDLEMSNLQRLLSSPDHRLFLWPWSDAFDLSLFTGWDFALVVTAALSDGSCARAGVDLLRDQARLDESVVAELVGNHGEVSTAAPCLP